MKVALHIAALIGLLGTEALAQDVQIEVQVPMDSSGTTMEITPALEHKLGLFPDVPRFLSARLFQINDTSYVLEVAHQINGGLAKRRSPMSTVEMEVLRRDVTHRLQTYGPTTFINQEGRGGLIFRQTMLSLGFYGWAIPEILKVASSRGKVAAYMLTSAGGFYLPYVLTKQVPVRNVHRMMSFYGATRGIAYGLLFEDLLLRDKGSERSALTFATVGSITGAFLSFKAVDWNQLSMGQGELLGVCGDFGIGFGFSTAYVMGLYDENNDETRQRLSDAVVLAFSSLGLGGGSWLVQREDYTQGDAYVLRAAGFLGVHIALPIVDATGTKEEKTYAAGMTIGSAVGL